jgi:uncharacterized membrane protein
MAHEIVLKSVTLNKPREAVYAFWRDFSNLSKFMENIERIDVLDDHTSHWVVKAPAGRSVEWDAVITEDDPGRRIAWDSSEGADINNSGFVEFRDAPEGRGSEIHAHIVYDPPAGGLGELIAKLFQREPGVQAHRDLRRLKMLLETGEIADSRAPDAAPRAHAGPV